MTDRDALAAVLAELERRNKRERFLAGDGLHDGGQRVMVLDQAKRKVWNCGRRFGKTKGAPNALFRAALSLPDVRAYYVNTSKLRAHDTVWDEFRRTNRDHHLGGEPDQRMHWITLPNESKVVATGVEDKTMADDLRGRPRVKLWLIDECQDWPPDLLKYFFEYVVYPSLADVDGDVILAGTGGSPNGWWWERTGDPAYKQFKYSIHDNPTLPKGIARALIDQACKERGCDEADPSIQREFYGRFVPDENRQIFPYVLERNGYGPGAPHQLPPGPPDHVVVAGDVGTVDFTSVGALGWWASDPRLWLLRHTELRKVGTTDQVRLFRSYMKDYAGQLCGVVIDPGGGGAPLIIDLGQGPNQIHVEAAEKQGKVAACLLLRDALRTGMFMVPADDETYIRDLTSVEWDPKAIGAVIRGHMPDPIDMTLYGFRKARALNWYKPPEPPKPPPTAAELMAQKWDEFDERAGREDAWLNEP